MNNMQQLKYFLVLVIGIHQVLATPTTISTADGRTYLLERSEQYNWYEAYIQCASRGLKLVSLDNAVKNTALVNVLKTSGYTRIWIGLIDSSVSGTRKFHWTSTGLETTFSYWQNGEPNGTEEDCVHMDSPDYRWNDNNCSRNKLGYICDMSC